jgi:ABC-type transport system involved in cytochrome c biogenesis permease subunit
MRGNITGSAAFVLLIAAAIVQIVYLLREQRTVDPFSHFLELAAAALLLSITIHRSIQIRFPAVTNTFESLVFFAAVIALVLFVYRLRTKQKTLPFVMFGGTIVALAILAIASSPIAPREVAPPIPALQSYWLALHVSLSFVGESFFVVAFVCSIAYVATRDEERRRRLDRLTCTTIGIGYPVFTAGALIFGAIWAEAAWGTYWSWDPKETWALITWLVYTAYLHTRLVKGLRGRWSAVLSIVGFLFTLFTFFGVNFLLPGLHSYA